jgi:nucleotide-binding universal stress UspA family protein
MLQRLLAPTDGSPESETALPLAVQIAHAQDAELVLVCVIDHPGITVRPSGDAAAVEREVVARLSETEARLRAAGLRVRSVVEQGSTAAMLLDREKLEAPDLVVLATHGRTGLARFALGSVADRLVREGTAPVLVVRRSTPPSTNLVSAMLMLDGSGLGEQALAVAADLAGKPIQQFTLFRTVADPQDRGAAQTYLEGAAGRLTSSGAKVTTVIDVGDPRVVTERAAKGHDLVILATHGRGGFDRWRHGSVADYVVRYLEQAVLLVRAKDPR